MFRKERKKHLIPTSCIYADTKLSSDLKNINVKEQRKSGTAAPSRKQISEYITNKGVAWLLERLLCRFLCAMRWEDRSRVFGCAVMMSKSSYVLLLLLHIVTTSDRFLIIERLDGEEFVR